MPGTASMSGMEPCSPCQRGTYSGAQRCEPCPAGLTTQFENTMSENDCISIGIRLKNICC